MVTMARSAHGGCCGLSFCGFVFVLTLSAAGSTFAANGDCGQPVSNGSAPVASDCLFILNAAAQLQTCDPVCICNTNGIGLITATDALLCLNVAVGAPISLNCDCATTTTTTTLDGGTTTTTLAATTTTTNTTSTTLAPPELIAEFDDIDTASVLASLLPGGLSFGLSYGGVSIVPGLSLASITGTAFVGLIDFAPENQTSQFEYELADQPTYDDFVAQLTDGENDALQRSAAAVTLGGLITLPTSTETGPEFGKFAPLTDLAGYEITSIRLIVHSVDIDFGVFASASWDITWQFWGRPQ